MEKEFRALIVTRYKNDGSLITYTLNHMAENRVAMFYYILGRYTNEKEEVDTIRILEENEV